MNVMALFVYAFRSQKRCLGYFPRSTSTLYLMVFVYNQDKLQLISESVRYQRLIIASYPLNLLSSMVSLSSGCCFDSFVLIIVPPICVSCFHVSALDFVPYTIQLNETRNFNSEKLIHRQSVFGAHAQARIRVTATH